VIGGILSVGTAVFLKMRDRLVREGTELLELLGVPLLGRMPYIKPEARNFRPSPVKLGRVEPSAI